MKVIETLFDSQSGYDSKNILNKSGKRVPQVHLDAIERGVTSEELEAMAKAGLKIFRYKTQITIHGLFPELGNNRIWGYTNLFQNKNQSIGVKYNAIDEQKRKRIASRIKYTGLQYARSSTDAWFGMSKAVNKDNWESVLAEMKAIKAKINTSLFTGGVSLFKGEAFGMQYLCLMLRVLIIPEKNVQPFIDSLISESEIEAIIEAEQLKKEQRDREYEIARQQSAAKEAEIMAAAQPDIDYLKSKYTTVKATNEPGTYLQIEVDHKDEIVYRVTHIHLPKRAKKPRWNCQNFTSMKDALAYTPQASDYDSTYEGRVRNQFKIA